MRKVLIIGGVMALVLFGLAAVGSHFVMKALQDKAKEQSTETAGAHDTGAESSAKAPAEGTGRSGGGVRPGYSGEPDQVLQELAKLRERQNEVAKQEQQLAARRRSLEIIQQDIRSERDDIDAVRKAVSDEVKGLRATSETIDNKKQQLDDKMREEAELVKDAKKGIYEADTVRSGGIKRVGGIYDTADPAVIARTFEIMAESGTDGVKTAAQILANMKDRKAAAVLSSIQDPATAAQLTEMMIGLKQAAPAGNGGTRPLGGPAARPASPPVEGTGPR